MADLLSEDPAAEFLQQEEDQLRELGIDDNQFDPVVNDTNDNGLDLMNEFQGEIDDIPTNNEPMVNGFDGSESQMEMQSSVSVITPAVEPESLKIWREEKAAALEKQEVEETAARKEWNEKAKKELDDWYARYNEQLEKVRNENRVAQEQFVEEMTDTKPGNEWEKTARFCDFNPKFSKNTKDVSRMRGLLLQLKQNPLVR